ncbi:palmitoyl-monogalactosyldiacylglycerol delta-7 desaturase, chloroplastic-like [Silene latifolia]|uniref:palmitoyl-monogalactosyldiacylglycerol delta-7 desaturase, chloroplastic-like n=1 Tax=Silene latifolia TaxID=37657 RepID=UPI003D771B84
MATITASIINPYLKPLLSLPRPAPTSLKARKLPYSSYVLNTRTNVTTMFSVRANATPKSTPNSNRIWRSDVVVNRAENALIGSKWNRLDIKTLFMIITTHGLAMFAPFYFDWGALWVALGLAVVTGYLGITLSYHRNLTHKSFKLPKWLEYLFAYLGNLAIQDDPITWVNTHRRHNKFCDTKQDPHSPIQGFWHSHINWMFDTTKKRRGEITNVEDLERQPFYRFLKSTSLLHSAGLGVLLYALGGFPYVVWGMGVRATGVLHITFLVNSVCHIWGNQAWNTGDLSKNNWWVALLTAGEGWHNNHHAFEYSARHGLEWWQIDLTWYIIALLEFIGLAKDVKLPTQAHKQHLAFKPKDVKG